MNENHDLKEAFFSANLHHYLPAISWESHPKIFKAWKKYHGPKLEKAISFPSKIKFLNNKPGIIVLFHLGYHLQVIQYLAREHVCFDILVSKHIKNKFEKYFKTLSKDLPPQINPNYFEAEDRTVILKIRESLKLKRYIVIFADGFLSSINDRLKPSEYISVDFFSNKIFVRKGIAVISYYFSSPIYPLINIETDGAIILDVKSPIMAKSDEHKDQYINRALQRLFNLLEFRIKNNIEHWECWSYLHQVGALKPPNSDFSSLSMSTTLPGVVKIKIEDRDYLFDKNNYNFFVIKKNNS